MQLASSILDDASVALVGNSLPRSAASQLDRSSTPKGLDTESRAWVMDLRAKGVRRERARERLHELLLKAARFEINRRRITRPHLRGSDLDDLAQQSADDALLAILSKLETFRGDSRFTTWA